MSNPSIDDRLQILEKTINVELEFEQSRLSSLEERERNGEDMCGDGWELMDNLDGRIHSYKTVLGVLKWGLETDDLSNIDHLDRCKPFMIAVCRGDIARDSGDYVVSGYTITYCPFCGKELEGYDV